MGYTLCLYVHTVDSSIYYSTKRDDDGLHCVIQYNTESINIVYYKKTKVILKKDRANILLKGAVYIY